MIVQEMHPIPKEASRYWIYWEGDGDPNHEHKIVGIRFDDRWGVPVLTIGEHCPIKPE